MLIWLHLFSPTVSRLIENDFAKLTRNTPKQAANLSNDEQNALKELKDNLDIVLWSREQYRSEVYAQLSGTSPLQPRGQKRKGT